VVRAYREPKEDPPSQFLAEGDRVPKRKRQGRSDEGYPVLIG
jgi:hypothetical protein